MRSSGLQLGSGEGTARRLVHRLLMVPLLLAPLALAAESAAQPLLSRPASGATFVADPCPFPVCTARVPYTLTVTGEPVDFVSLVYTGATEPATDIPLCQPADPIEGTEGCPLPPHVFDAALLLREGIWTIHARVTRGATVETSNSVTVTVLPSTLPPAGPVKVTAITPNFGAPAIRTREADSSFGLERTTGDIIEIVGENLDTNPFLEVYLAPKPLFEPSISPESSPQTADWCKLPAEIVGAVSIGGGASKLQVRLPEVPLSMHTTCGVPAQGFSSSFAKNWRWAIRDRWIRPERVHEWVAWPPQPSHPGHDAPPFRLVKPAYPLINGFRFDNQKTDATYKEFLSVFGNNAYICLGAFGLCATRVPDPFYHLLWWPIYMLAVDSTGGSCAGMSSTSLLMAREELQAKDFDPAVYFPVGLRTTYDPTYEGTSFCSPFCGPYKPTNLWGTIRMNHGVQISRQFLREIVDTLGEAIFDPNDITSVKGVPVATLQRVASNPQGYVLCFFKPGKGHCVTPYRVDGNRIYIYDNNHPQVVADTYIDIIDGDYHYPFRTGEPNKGNAIMAFPIDIWKEGRNLFGLTDFTSIGGTAFLQMLSFGSADVLVTTETGGRWGWEDDGTFTDNLLGAVALPPLGPPADDVRQMPLLLAMNQPAPTVQVNAKGGKYYVHAAEGRLSLQLEATDAQAGDKDRVRLTYNSGRLAATDFTPARRANHIVARIALAIGADERALFHLVGLDVPGGRTVKVGGGVDARTVTYQNDTGNTTHHFLLLDYVAGPAETHGRMLYGPFEVPQGASHQVMLNGWPNVSTVRSGLDLDGNGTIDKQQNVTGRPVVAPTDLSASADLWVEKTATPVDLVPGDPVSYTITVRNSGPAAATAVRLDDALPSFATPTQATTTHGVCAVVPAGLTCELGTLAAGETATVQYTVVPTRPGFLANGATVSGAEGDPNWTNNTAVAVADVRALIDIEPGSTDNPINLGRRGLTPVAILGSGTFSVADIDSRTLRFGPAGVLAQRANMEDVNRDGFLDLVAQFERRSSGLAAGDAIACVRGEMVLGSQFRGCDAVRVVPR